MVEQTWPTAEKLILNILGLARQLYKELADEADLLKDSPKAELIDMITANKKKLVVQLEQLNQQFARILAAEKLANNKDGVNGYFQRVQTMGLATDEPQKNWALIQRICAECKTLNEQNGAGIELLAQHTKRTLDILKGKPTSTNTYGRDGITKSDPLTHTLTFYL